MLRCWCQRCLLGKELVLAPVPPPCMAPSPLLSWQAFLPLLKKAAQGSPGSALSCNKAAIVNMSSSASSIKEVYFWDYAQAVSYRCSKVPPRCAGCEPRRCPPPSDPTGLPIPPSVPARLRTVTELPPVTGSPLTPHSPALSLPRGLDASPRIHFPSHRCPCPVSRRLP